MLLTNVKPSRPRLPLSESELRAAVRKGQFTDVILHGITPNGFHLEGVYHPHAGLPVPAVLVNRSGATKSIKCPDRAMEYVRGLGVQEFEVDVSEWDPGQAFDPARESFLSRRRRQNFEEAVKRLEERLGEPYEPGTPAINQQRLEQFSRLLGATQFDDVDLRAVALCWCDVYLTRFPIPERASKALYRYSRGSGIECEGLEQLLADCCSEEFKRRCKNQYLASLDLGDSDHSSDAG
jgi:hypothetical protein